MKNSTIFLLFTLLIGCSNISHQELGILFKRGIGNSAMNTPLTNSAEALRHILMVHTSNMDEIRLLAKAEHYFNPNGCYTPKDMHRFLNDHGYTVQILHQPIRVANHDLIIRDMNSCHQDFTFYSLEGGVVHEYHPESSDKKRNKLWRVIPAVPKGSHYNVTVLRHDAEETSVFDSQH